MLSKSDKQNILKVTLQFNDDKIESFHSYHIPIYKGVKLSDVIKEVSQFIYQRFDREYELSYHNLDKVSENIIIEHKKQR
jgi:hypothetical protein